MTIPPINYDEFGPVNCAQALATEAEHLLKTEMHIDRACAAILAERVRVAVYRALTDSTEQVRLMHADCDNRGGACPACRSGGAL